MSSQLKRDMIGVSPESKTIFAKIPAVVKARRNTLITGPTGSGKEVLARMLYRKAFSTRTAAPFIPINCGALPHELIESELFGHTKGAFTGATPRKGLIHAAQDGVLFLDEINTANLLLQSKLLRFTESMEYRAVGSDRIQKANLWVLAATNQNLEEEVKKGNFREDLMYRLNVVTLDIPPLKKRPSDIIPLIQHFLSLFNARDYQFTTEALAHLEQHTWPGNVRELKHCIEKAVIFSNNKNIDVVDLQLKTVNDENASESGKNNDTVVDLWNLVENKGLSLSEAMAYCEQKLILAALKYENNNRSRAAQRLRIHNRTIFKKISNLDASKSHFM